MRYDIILGKTALLIICAQQEYFDPKLSLFTPNAAKIIPNGFSFESPVKGPASTR